MYNYYKSSDPFFTHYYRVKKNEKDLTGCDLGRKCLHVNVTSSCINIGFFSPYDGLYTIISENDFNDALEKVMDDLGIVLRKFTFL